MGRSTVLGNQRENEIRLVDKLELIFYERRLVDSPQSLTSYRIAIRPNVHGLHARVQLAASVGDQM